MMGLFSLFRRPLAPFVVLSGLDGSGKSTVLAAIGEMDLPVAGVVFGNRRPSQRVKSGGAGVSGAPEVVTHYSKPNHGFVKSTLKLAVVVVDWLVGYVRQIRPCLVARTMVVYDRHYLIDLGVDPDRYRYGGALALVKVARKFVPRPHLVIFLDVSEAVSQARKAETGAPNFAEQRRAYLEMGKAESDWQIVDATRPLPEVLAEVEALLKTCLRQF